jgi:hypothetical protein
MKNIRQSNINIHKDAWVEINLEYLAQNIQAIKKTIPQGKKMMAIVKADAYGHGAVKTAYALLEEGATRFAVSNLEEAIQLRQAGIACPILLLSYTPADEVKKLAEFHVTQTVVSLAHAKALSAAGIPFVMPQAKEILKMHEMKGRIIIDSDYCDRSRIGEIVRRLPEAGYDYVTKYQVEELIKIIKWDNLKEVKLCKIKH